MRQPVVVALVLGLAGLAGVAGSEELPAGTDVTIGPRNGAALALGYGGPLGAAATVDLVHGFGLDARDDREHVKAIVGAVGQLRAGSGGLGVGLGVAAHGHGRSDEGKGSAGFGLVVSFARTWRTSTDVGPRSYLGPELELSLMRVDLRLGTLWRVAGAPGRRAILSWGLGFRL